MALIGGLTLNELAAKVIGYAILTGSIGLKVPQILAILSSKAVEGIEPISFYGEVPLMIMSVVYFYLEGYPFSAFGDTAFILVQNIILVILLWIYAKPSIPKSTILGISIFFVATAFGCLNVPQEYRSFLPLLQLPITIASRVPQIIKNFQERSTGKLSVVTTFLMFAGSCARIFTTIQEKGMDVPVLSGFAIGSSLSGILLLQIVIFGDKSTAEKKKEEKKKE